MFTGAKCGIVVVDIWKCCGKVGLKANWQRKNREWVNSFTVFPLPRTGLLPLGLLYVPVMHNRIYSRFSKVIIFNQISVDDKLKIARKCYTSLIARIDNEKKLIENNSVLELFERVIKEGAYPNMRIFKKRYRGCDKFWNFEGSRYHSVNPKTSFPSHFNFERRAAPKDE